MRICIFSDIHGNGAAFSVAYDMIVSEKADINVFLGDLCGYYFDQKEILSMLQAIPKLVAIKGNHDFMFLRIVDGDEELRRTYLGKYGCSMENLLSDKNQELIRWLSELMDSHFFPDMGLACYHGSPWDHLDGYIYPTDPIDRFRDFPYKFVSLGHTHYPMHKKVDGLHIINPGSCGQPRNGGWPTYAVIDHLSGNVRFKEVVYDKAELLRRIDEVGDNNQHLKEILNR